MAKVFGVGFHKTGTTTLAHALRQLGYRACHGAGPARAALGHQEMMRRLHAGQYEAIVAAARPFDALSDNPWYLLFRELDVAYPGSRFILTHRDEARWLRSVLNHFGHTRSDLRHWIYGEADPVGRERLFLDRYRAHNEAVRAYFADRPQDLLTVDWGKGDGWETLCTFLDRPAPDTPFPHANPGRYPGLLTRLRRRLRDRR